MNSDAESCLEGDWEIDDALLSESFRAENKEKNQRKLDGSNYVRVDLNELKQHPTFSNVLPYLQVSAVSN